MSVPSPMLSRNLRMKAMFDNSLKLVEKHETYKPARKPEPNSKSVEHKSGDKLKPKVEPSETITSSTSSISAVSSASETGDTGQNSIANILKIAKKHGIPKPQKSSRMKERSGEKEPSRDSVEPVRGGGDKMVDAESEEEDYSEFSYEDSSGQDGTLNGTGDSKNINSSLQLGNQKSKDKNMNGPSSLQAISSVSVSSKPGNKQSTQLKSSQKTMSNPSQPKEMKKQSADNTLSSIKTELSASSTSKSKSHSQDFSPSSAFLQKSPKLSQAINQILSKPLFKTANNRSSISTHFGSSKLYSKSIRSDMERKSRLTAQEEKVLLKSQIQQRTSDWIVSTSESLSNGTASGSWLKASLTGSVNPSQKNPSQTSRHSKSLKNKVINEKEGQQLPWWLRSDFEQVSDHSSRKSRFGKDLENSETSVSEQLPEDTPRTVKAGSRVSSMHKAGGGMHEKDVFSARKLSSLNEIPLSISSKITTTTTKENLKSNKSMEIELPPEPKVPNDMPIRDLVLAQQKKQKERSDRIVEELRKKSLPEVYELNPKKTKNAFEEKMNREIDSIMRKIAAPSGLKEAKSYDTEFLSSSENPELAPHNTKMTPPDEKTTDKTSRRTRELTGLFNHVMAANAEVFLQALKTAKELKKISEKQKQKSALKAKRNSKKKKTKGSSNPSPNPPHTPKIYIKNLLIR